MTPGAMVLWLRQKFGELGVLQFEDWEDTGAEYERMQLDSSEIKSA